MTGIATTINLGQRVGRPPLRMVKWRVLLATSGEKQLVSSWVRMNPLERIRIEKAAADCGFEPELS